MKSDMNSCIIDKLASLIDSKVELQTGQHLSILPLLSLRIGIYLLPKSFRQNIKNI